MAATRRFRGIEVNGRNVRAVTDAIRLFPDAALKPLLKHGIGRVGPDGKTVVDASGWYPLADWVAVIEEIVRTVGSSKMFEIGKQVPRTATFPPDTRDVAGALRTLDIAYHMNLRKDGVVMFNAATGEVVEGVGHYRVTMESPTAALVHCDDPFPCDLDKGILLALAQRFEPGAAIQHLDEATCRKRGGAACRYRVTW